MHRCVTFVCLAALGLLFQGTGQAAEPVVEKELLVESFQSVARCPGLQRETQIVHSGEASGRWSRMDRAPRVQCLAAPHDWSEYNALSLWVYNAKRLPDTRLIMIIGSERKETEGEDYYSMPLDLGLWTGWKRFLVWFDELGVARHPVGWRKVDQVTFHAAGWGNTPNPEAAVCFADFRLLKLPELVGPRLTDEELFAAMDLDQPALAPIKAAVAAADYPRARAAWLEHLEARTQPKWYIDWRARPKKRPPPAGGSPGWDYYARGMVLDWAGWKHFRLTKGDFHASRKPIGWNWIDYLSFHASGFGQTPDPNAVLYLDDVRLVRKGKEGKVVMLSDFEQGVGAWRGLVRSDEQSHSGRHSGKWQQMHVTTAIRLDDIPTDWSDVEALEFWCYSPRPCGARLTIVLDSDQPRFERAEQVLKHVIQGYDFGSNIDWSADPHHYREWTYSINRFFHWRTLCDAYWQSGDERYAEEFCNQLGDWVRKNPVPLFVSGNGSYTWRTIECGIRQSTTWPECLYRVLGSKSFTPEVAAVMTKSMVEHARHLMQWPSRSNNWLTMESNGLCTIGTLLPEFREAAEWRSTGLARQYAELDNQVYPDGAQKELTTGYHQVSLRNFLGLARTCKLNGIDIPRDYYEKLRKMFEYNLYVQMPDSRTPALNDGGMHDVREDMATAYDLYHDPVFDWAASDHTRGASPEQTSHFFPYAGQMVMRSGWEPGAAYLLMDAGPFGVAHQHEDKLSIVVYAHGKLQILDPGNYHYDSSPWRKYTIDTPAHNTVMVDGLSQCRRRLPREQYVVERPPESNLWLSGPRVDYAAGVYDDGYGPKGAVKVAHRRQIVFVKPEYWLVVDTFSATGQHGYESLFRFNADEASIDGDTPTVRTIDPSPNCLIAAARQPDLSVRIVKGQTEPTIQGFVAGEHWRPSWKDPKRQPPEHGKREVPTAVFTLKTDGPARVAHVIYPYAKGQQPQVSVEDITKKGGPVRVRIKLPSGRTDEIAVHNGAEVMRDGSPWASVGPIAAGNNSK